MDEDTALVGGPDHWEVQGRSTVTVFESTDPGLIGGLVVQIGSTVFDGSVRRQLTARRWWVQKRSRRVFFSTLPELFLGRSVSENSTRLGSL